jgi:DNA polymerase-3 subunit chi
MSSDQLNPESSILSPRIDFYFNVDHRLQYACRLVRKARGANLSVLAFARDPDRLARFDTALWTFSALDFLPHVYADSPLASVTPIVLSLRQDDAPARDVLLNLDDETPPAFATWFTQFARVVEIVSREDDDRARARRRFKAYRDCGLAPTAHEVGNE